MNLAADPSNVLTLSPSYLLWPEGCAPGHLPQGLQKSRKLFTAVKNSLIITTQW